MEVTVTTCYFRILTITSHAAIKLTQPVLWNEKPYAWLCCIQRLI